MTTRPTATADTALASRQLRREQLAVLLSRAARDVLTPAEGPLLRAAVETELTDAEIAHQELANQRETFTIAYDALTARAERAEQQLAEAQCRITTLEHVARGNKRHVQYVVRILENVRRVARNYPGLRHLHAALDDTQQPDTDSQDSHTGACAPPCCAVDPNPAEHPNGAHTDAHDR